MPPDAVPTFLAGAPSGFAAWWLSYYGPDLTDGERDGVTMAVIAWEAALHFAGWRDGRRDRSPIDPNAELAAYCKARGLVPPDPVEPVVRYGR